MPVCCGWFGADDGPVLGGAFGPVVGGGSTWPSERSVALVLRLVRGRWQAMAERYGLPADDAAGLLVGGSDDDHHSQVGW